MPSLSPISGTLGSKRAAHLLRRATFGYSKTDIEEYAALTADQAIAKLMVVSAKPAPPVDPKTNETWLPQPSANNSDDLALFKVFKAWYLEVMRNANNLNERMTYFWHTHLPADHTLVPNTTALYYQNVLYRTYALGNYKTLFTKVCADNAMLVYIDNTLNVKGAPNENFAREMLELYTIGKGTQLGPDDYTNYTEQDVQEAARVLTGLRHEFDFDHTNAADPEQETENHVFFTDPDTDLPRGNFKDRYKGTITRNEEEEQVYFVTKHDTEPKIFSDKFGGRTIAPKPEEMKGDEETVEGAWDELHQMMDMIFEQEETARFICRKLYRFFVYYKITDAIEQDVIEPLAETFRTNNYEVKPVLEQLLASQHFFDEDIAETTTHIRGAQIKSPIELTLGTFKTFGIELPTDDPVRLYELAYNGILESLEYQGISFYSPIDVAGYPPYHQTPNYNRNWISPNYLARRYELANLLVEGQQDNEDELLYKLDVMPFINTHISDPSSGVAIVRELIDLLFTHDVPQYRYEYFLNDLLLDNLSLDNWAMEWETYKNSNDDSGVRKQLERLVVGMLQTPEYQLF